MSLSKLSTGKVLIEVDGSITIEGVEPKAQLTILAELARYTAIQASMGNPPEDLSQGVDFTKEDSLRTYLAANRDALAAAIKLERLPASIETEYEKPLADNAVAVSSLLPYVANATDTDVTKIPEFIKQRQIIEGHDERTGLAEIVAGDKNARETLAMLAVTGIGNKSNVMGALNGVIDKITDDQAKAFGYDNKDAIRIKLGEVDFAEAFGFRSMFDVRVTDPTAAERQRQYVLKTAFGGPSLTAVLKDPEARKTLVENALRLDKEFLASNPDNVDKSSSLSELVGRVAVYGTGDDLKTLLDHDLGGVKLGEVLAYSAENGGPMREARRRLGLDDPRFEVMNEGDTALYSTIGNASLAARQNDVAAIFNSYGAQLKAGENANFTIQDFDKAQSVIDRLGKAIAKINDADASSAIDLQRAKSLELLQRSVISGQEAIAATILKGGPKDLKPEDLARLVQKYAPRDYDKDTVPTPEQVAAGLSYASFNSEKGDRFNLMTDKTFQDDDLEPMRAAVKAHYERVDANVARVKQELSATVPDFLKTDAYKSVVDKELLAAHNGVDLANKHARETGFIGAVVASTKSTLQNTLHADIVDGIHDAKGPVYAELARAALNGKVSAEQDSADLSKAQQDAIRHLLTHNNGKLTLTDNPPTVLDLGADTAAISFEDGKVTLTPTKDGPSYNLTALSGGINAATLAKVQKTQVAGYEGRGEMTKLDELKARLTKEIETSVKAFAKEDQTTLTTSLTASMQMYVSTMGEAKAAELLGADDVDAKIAETMKTVQMVAAETLRTEPADKTPQNQAAYTQSTLLAAAIDPALTEDTRKSALLLSHSGNFVSRMQIKAGKAFEVDPVSKGLKIGDTILPQFKSSIGVEAFINAVRDGVILPNNDAIRGNADFKIGMDAALKHLAGLDKDANINSASDGNAFITARNEAAKAILAKGDPATAALAAAYLRNMPEKTGQHDAQRDTALANLEYMATRTPAQLMDAGFAVTTEANITIQPDGAIHITEPGQNPVVLAKAGQELTAIPSYASLKKVAAAEPTPLDKWKQEQITELNTSVANFSTKAPFNHEGYQAAIEAGKTAVAAYINGLTAIPAKKDEQAVLQKSGDPAKQAFLNQVKTAHGTLIAEAVRLRQYGEDGGYGHKNGPDPANRRQTLTTLTTLDNKQALTKHFEKLGMQIDSDTAKLEVVDGTLTFTDGDKSVEIPAGLTADKIADLTLKAASEPDMTRTNAFNAELEKMTRFDPKDTRLQAAIDQARIDYVGAPEESGLSVTNALANQFKTVNTHAAQLAYATLVATDEGVKDRAAALLKLDHAAFAKLDAAKAFSFETNKLKFDGADVTLGAGGAAAWLAANVKATEPTMDPKEAALAATIARIPAYDHLPEADRLKAREAVKTALKADFNTGKVNPKSYGTIATDTDAQDTVIMMANQNAAHALRAETSDLGRNSIIAAIVERNDEVRATIGMAGGAITKTGALLLGAEGPGYLTRLGLDPNKALVVNNNQFEQDGKSIPNFASQTAIKAYLAVTNGNVVFPDALKADPALKGAFEAAQKHATTLADGKAKADIMQEGNVFGAIRTEAIKALQGSEKEALATAYLKSLPATRMSHGDPAKDTAQANLQFLLQQKAAELIEAGFNVKEGKFDVQPDGAIRYTDPGENGKTFLLAAASTKLEAFPLKADMTAIDTTREVFNASVLAELKSTYGDNFGWDVGRNNEASAKDILGLVGDETLKEIVAAATKDLNPLPADLKTWMREDIVLNTENDERGPRSTGLLRQMREKYTEKHGAKDITTFGTNREVLAHMFLTSSAGANMMTHERDTIHLLRNPELTAKLGIELDGENRMAVVGNELHYNGVEIPEIFSDGHLASIVAIKEKFEAGNGYDKTKYQQDLLALAKQSFVEGPHKHSALLSKSDRELWADTLGPEYAKKIDAAVPNGRTSFDMGQVAAVLDVTYGRYSDLTKHPLQPLDGRAGLIASAIYGKRYADDPLKPGEGVPTKEQFDAIRERAQALLTSTDSAVTTAIGAQKFSVKDGKLYMGDKEVPAFKGDVTPETFVAGLGIDTLAAFKEQAQAALIKQLQEGKLKINGQELSAEASATVLKRLGEDRIKAVLDNELKTLPEIGLSQYVASNAEQLVGKAVKAYVADNPNLAGAPSKDMLAHLVLVNNGKDGTQAKEQARTAAALLDQPNHAATLGFDLSKGRIVQAERVGLQYVADDGSKVAIPYIRSGAVLSNFAASIKDAEAKFGTSGFDYKKHISEQAAIAYRTRWPNEFDRLTTTGDADRLQELVSRGQAEKIVGDVPATFDLNHYRDNLAGRASKWPPISDASVVPDKGRDGLLQVTLQAHRLIENAEDEGVKKAAELASVRAVQLLNDSALKGKLTETQFAINEEGVLTANGQPVPEVDSPDKRQAFLTTLTAAPATGKDAQVEAEFNKLVDPVIRDHAALKDQLATNLGIAKAAVAKDGEFADAPDGAQQAAKKGLKELTTQLSGSKIPAHVLAHTMLTQPDTDKRHTNAKELLSADPEALKKANIDLTKGTLTLDEKGVITYKRENGSVATLGDDKTIAESLASLAVYAEISARKQRLVDNAEDFLTAGKYTLNDGAGGIKFAETFPKLDTPLHTAALEAFKSHINGATPNEMDPVRLKGYMGAAREKAIEAVHTTAAKGPDSAYKTLATTWATDKAPEGTNTALAIQNLLRTATIDQLKAAGVDLELKDSSVTLTGATDNGVIEFKKSPEHQPVRLTNSDGTLLDVASIKAAMDKAALTKEIDTVTALGGDKTRQYVDAKRLLYDTDGSGKYSRFFPEEHFGKITVEGPKRNIPKLEHYNEAMQAALKEIETLGPKILKDDRAGTVRITQPEFEYMMTKAATAARETLLAKEGLTNAEFLKAHTIGLQKDNPLRERIETLLKDGDPDLATVGGKDTEFKAGTIIVDRKAGTIALKPETPPAVTIAEDKILEEAGKLKADALKLLDEHLPTLDKVHPAIHDKLRQGVEAYLKNVGNFKTDAGAARLPDDADIAKAVQAQMVLLKDELGKLGHEGTIQENAEYRKIAGLDLTKPSDKAAIDAARAGVKTELDENMATLAAHIETSMILDDGKGANDAKALQDLMAKYEALGIKMEPAEKAKIMSYGKDDFMTEEQYVKNVKMLKEKAEEALKDGVVDVGDLIAVKDPQFKEAAKLLKKNVAGQWDDVAAVDRDTAIPQAHATEDDLAKRTGGKDRDAVLGG
ncbi:MAG: hypothetical protein MRY32_09325 [Rickettsiales bacterium]|nr:hypothetical protein [Rickettsiales bacterium]